MKILFLHRGHIRIGTIVNQARHRIVIEYDDYIDRNGIVVRKYVLRTLRSIRGIIEE